MYEFFEVIVKSRVNVFVSCSLLIHLINPTKGIRFVGIFSG